MTYITMSERVMTIKGHQVFGEEEVHPPPRRENPGYAYVETPISRSGLCFCAE